MNARILTDADVEALITPAIALRAMEDAFRALKEGRLSAPPRVQSRVGAVELDFTTGSLEGRWTGYRSNANTSPRQPREQVVVLSDEPSGKVRGVAIGGSIGPYRTGAIGAVAAGCLASDKARTMTIIGTGQQAWTQLWAISSVRKLEDVYVYSRNEEKRNQFALQASSRFATKVTAVATPEPAVRDSEIVVLATTSRQPVIDANWLRPGTHINTLGAKSRNGSEFGPDVLDACSIFVTDSSAQFAMTSDQLLIGRRSHIDWVSPLAELVTSPHAARTREEEVSIFFSVGLAGTELFLLDSLLNADTTESKSEGPRTN